MPKEGRNLDPQNPEEWDDATREQILAKHLPR